MLVFLQYFSSNVYYLNDSIYLWNCRNQGQLLNKKVISWSVLPLKCLHEIFYNSQFKNIIATLRIVSIEKSELTFLLILYFHDCINRTLSPEFYSNSYVTYLDLSIWIITSSSAVVDLDCNNWLWGDYGKCFYENAE